jgi:hypothetical protein
MTRLFTQSQADKISSLFVGYLIVERIRESVSPPLAIQREFSHAQSIPDWSNFFCYSTPFRTPRLSARSFIMTKKTGTRIRT